MTTQADRRALHAYVSNEAHERWHDFAAEQGVSVSAVLEALASHVLGVVDGDSEAGGLRSVVQEARRIDAQRRRRRPG
ncbi:MAG: hypothetical protein R2710_15950 [Acidimicrobiales bacterium]